MLTGETALTERVIGCAIEVHRNTGPGLLESVYDGCLALEFEAAGLAFARQVSVPVVYKGHPTRSAFRIDYVIERCVLVELKSVDTLLDVHKAQVLTYLRLSDLRLGLLINFNVPILRMGIRRLSLLRSPESFPADSATSPLPPV